MSGKGARQRRRAQENEALKTNLLVLLSRISWRKALGEDLGVCQWRGAHHWRDEQDCTNVAHWTATLEGYDVRLCDRHAAQVHNQPWRIKGLFSRRLVVDVRRLAVSKRRP